MGKRSVILLSGGLDSSANLAFCRESDEPVLALTIRYGQRAADREVETSKELCRYYDVRHEVVDVPWLGSLGGSALTDAKQILPKLDSDQLDDLEITQKTAKSVWVPNRNGIFINIAGAYAERLGAERVVVGFNSEEAATFPDNSIEYLKHATEALGFSTANGVRAFSYTAAWDKSRIVAELKKLSKPFPLDRVWSCYQSGPRPCGVCESCKRLARAIGNL